MGNRGSTMVTKIDWHKLLEDHRKDMSQLDSKLKDLLVEYGGKVVLFRLGEVLMDLEGAGNAYPVGRALQVLGDVEW